MTTYTPPLPWLNIIYEDDYLIAVNKPSGLLSVPGRGDTPDKKDSLITRVQQRNPLAKCVHRLDMETSGVLVVACSKEMESKISEQFRNRKVQKVYIARVWGHPEQDEGEIDLPLVVDWPNRPLHKVCYEIGKPSITHYQVVERYGDFTSRLLLMPKTGRTHQIRVHLQTIGHPIVGDTLYASPQVRAMAARMLLHAETLLIRHPHYQTPFHVYCKAEF